MVFVKLQNILKFNYFNSYIYISNWYIYILTTIMEETIKGPIPIYDIKY